MVTRYRSALLSFALCLFGVIGLVFVNELRFAYSQVSSAVVTAPVLPAIPCANGQPWKLNSAGTKYACPEMPDCPKRCTMNAGAPLEDQCFASDGLPFWSPDHAVGSQQFTIMYDSQGFQLDNQTVGGFQCAWRYRKWNGELSQ